MVKGDCEFLNPHCFWKITHRLSIKKKGLDIIEDVAGSSIGIWQREQNHVCIFAENEQEQWQRNKGFRFCDVKRQKECSNYKKQGETT